MQYPLRHISIRVPWHDAGWNGTVCACPTLNTACLKLKNIAASKDDKAEECLAGESLQNLDSEQFPPCVKERATFMAPFALERQHAHPYARPNSDTHAHFRPTILRYPAYAAAGLPFRWLMKSFVFNDEGKNASGLIEEFPLEDIDRSYEPQLDFETNWLQDHRNHRVLLDCFWNHIRPQESLVFFYAKQVPLVEDTGRRVIVGVGRVWEVGDLTEYQYDRPATKAPIRSLLWERMVKHSIRPDFADGFILPYHEALAKSEGGIKFDPAEAVAFAPEDRFTEFSYATEHLGPDAAISALLACRNALERAEELFGYDKKRQDTWIDAQLGRLWRLRGAFPGLGAVLAATGLEMGNFIGLLLQEKAGEEGNPWTLWEETLAEPSRHLPASLASNLDDTIRKSWKHKSPERRQFLDLLSRMDLSTDQADILANPEIRDDKGILGTDADFLANPYLVYENTRLTPWAVGIGTVDRGVLPARFVRDKFQLPGATAVTTTVDARRMRALVVRELESAAVQGHTLQAKATIVRALRERTDDPDERRTPVSGDLLAVAEAENFGDVVHTVSMADGTMAYQLDRFAKIGELIRRTVQKRTSAGTKRHIVKADWRGELDKVLGPLMGNADEQEKERLAREEKTSALTELAAARLSVLIGPAGTGKTTLLSVLCSHPEVATGRILLLAPTGKARVRMEAVARAAGIQQMEAATLAQFLSRTTPKRYDGNTQRYCITGVVGELKARTVIVDECSMLTEEMLGALFDALGGVQRLILVGDPRQLPPIGAGRPFADIISFLTPEAVESKFPQVGPSYAALTIPRRQGAGERDDLQLANWFGGGSRGPGEDQVFEILTGQRSSDTIRFVRWDSPEELTAALPGVLASALGFDPDLEEWQSFALSLGGVLDDRGSAWFNLEYGKRQGSGRAAESWQILSPVRQQPWGVNVLNHHIQLRYKGLQIEQARRSEGYRSIPPPRGEQQIIYGSKVINNRNWSVPAGRLYPNEEGMRGYLANGEIGMVVGHRKTRFRSFKPENLEIEFATQPGLSVKYYESDFSDEKDSGLELAYALTIHKAQGSEFDTVILVLPKSPLMLSRELLYTALTRQKKQVLVLHEGSATDLHRMSGEGFSATAARLTNLFGPPRPVEVGQRFLEDRLIHRTSRGDAVRSKSEVIIANLLHTHGLAYHYESPLELDGIIKYPDFTIEDDDTGQTYYWEHCGMLHDPAYRRRWEAKLVWYAEHGILPNTEGGGPNGTLIITKDDPAGGIDSHEITGILKSLF
ncbi:AAA family ATPase [Hymenobacter metallicola]|uniref:RNA helicase n=1 Tax=Hymenobacter metallicola TaxID=2563114 RepID=A0A4Z0PUF4_9BACT|nr:AAA family ATPase [Hymenobacter metallicola]TGE20884.1 RNA helicase [Hymenobacter metallicola]